ncbi:acyl carrier protein [Lachnospiraceae bacterium]|nr:acyl carrier protein [Lachnospiraceae bacterium]
MLLEKVKRILLRYTEEGVITQESQLAADLGMSSFDLVSVVTEFEDEFGIEIADRDIRRFICVGDIVEYLNRKVLK